MTVMALLGVIAGVLMSVFVVVHQTDNPSEIPVGRVALRALGGLGIHVVFWIAFSAVVFVCLPNVVTLEVEPFLRGCLGLILGIGLPQLIRIKDTWLDQTFAQNHPLLFQIAQAFDEFTGKYLGKIIAREERKDTADILHGAYGDLNAAIDQLYEYHKKDILRTVADRLPPDRRNRAKGIPFVRDRVIKVKYLMRHLGTTELLKTLMALRAGAMKRCFENWPRGTEDRRQADRRQVQEDCEGPDRRSNHGRREIDHPAFHEQVERLVAPTSESA